MKFVVTSFIRSVDGEFCLCNLRMGSGVVINDASEFLKPMLAGENVEIAAQDIANKYNMPLYDVLRDLTVFYQTLTSLGLLKFAKENRDRIVASGNDNQAKGVASKEHEGSARNLAGICLERLHRAHRKRRGISRRFIGCHRDVLEVAP